MAIALPKSTQNHGIRGVQPLSLPAPAHAGAVRTRQAAGSAPAGWCQRSSLFLAILNTSAARRTHTGALQLPLLLLRAAPGCFLGRLALPQRPARSPPAAAGLPRSRAVPDVGAGGRQDVLLHRDLLALQHQMRVAEAALLAERAEGPQ